MILRTHSLALALLSLVSIAPSRAIAGPPSPANCTCPTAVRLVGSAGGVPDTAAGRFTIVIRDFSNNPYPNEPILLDFSACPDLRLAANPLDPRLTVDCAAHTVAGSSGPDGSLTLTLLGSSGAATTFCGAGAVRSYVEGILMREMTVAAFDLDGSGGVDTGDLSVWLGDLGTHTYRARSDYDADGSITTADLSIWLAENGTHRSSVSGTPCP